MPDDTSPKARQRRGRGTAPTYVARRKAFRVRPPRLPGERYATDIWVKAAGPDDSAALTAAWKALDAALVDRDRSGRKRGPDRSTTTGRWARRYVDELASNLRPESRRTYRHVLPHIEREVGRIRLHDLQPSDVKAMLTRLEARGMTANRRYSVLNLLRLSLQAAVDDERVTRNVARLVESPRRTTPQLRPPTPDEVMRVLDVVGDDPVYGAAYHLAVATGMRQSELVGLRWQDLQGGRLYIDGQLERNGDTLVAPKTEASRRSIDLPGHAIRALVERRRWQLEDGSTSADGWMFTVPSSGYSSRRRPGAPLRATVLLEHFQRVCEQLSIGPYRWHDLRHATATRLLKRTGDVHLVQKAMGHSSIATTARYLHTEGDLSDALDIYSDRKEGQR